MGIAQGLGNAGLTPGIYTSSTRPASPADGLVISETDTDTLQIYKGSTWGSASALQLIKTQTIGTAVSSVTVSDVFSATYDAYRIVVTNLLTSASTGIEMTLGATAAGYYYVSSAALFTNGNYSVQVGESNVAKWVVIGNTGAGTSSNSYDLTSPFLASRTFFSGGYISTGGGAAGVLSGYLDNTTSYTAFTIRPNSGTMTGGTIRVYGYANS